MHCLTKVITLPNSTLFESDADKPTGKEALFLNTRAQLLRMRLSALKSSQCATKKNRYHCPEIFLDVVSTKLTSTAVLFLNVELLSEFYYKFPRELDVRLGRGLSKDEVERFAKEDPRVRGHLEVIRRKELLELVLGKMDGVRALEVEERGRRGSIRTLGKEKKEGRGWGLF